MSQDVNMTNFISRTAGRKSLVINLKEARERTDFQPPPCIRKMDVTGTRKHGKSRLGHTVIRAKLNKQVSTYT